MHRLLKQNGTLDGTITILQCACTMANKFLKHNGVQLGWIARVYNSNCDPQLCGNFWDKLTSLLDMKLTFSMALHH